MPAHQDLLITVGHSPASDGWGFVGLVSVGDREAYRTIRAHVTPSEALAAARAALADVLGSLLAGQEWRLAQEEFGHAPRRTELELGLLADQPPPLSDRVSPDGTRGH